MIKFQNSSMIFATYYRRICHTLLGTSSRFPLAILCSLAFCIIAIMYNRIDDSSLYLVTLFCGWCWFLAIRLFWESHCYRHRSLYYAALNFFLLLGYYIRSEVILSANSMVLGMGLFLLLFCAPFLNRSHNNLQFWLFNYRLWCRIAYAWLAALILFLGVAAVLSCLEYLFSLRLFKDQYTDLGLISFTFFFPFLVLIGVPVSFDSEPETDKAEPIYYLLEYLVVPLLFIYSLILYIYLVKIAITQSLPRGRIAYLVSSYGGVGILTYLAGIPVNVSRGRLLAIFRQYFFKILIFPAILLAVGLIYRLQQYGLTESRYLLVLCFIWFSSVIFLSFIVKSHLLAKAIYVPLPFLLLLASFGPWSISSLPVFDQSRRLHQILQQNHIMQDGKIIPGTHKINFEDQKRISEILDYITLHKKTDSLKSWVSNADDKDVLGNKEKLYIKPEKIAALMGVEYIDQSQRNNRNTFFSYHFEKQDYLKTTGYNYLISSVYLSTHAHKSTTMITQEIKVAELGQSITISFDQTANTLTINKGDQVLITASLNDLVAELRLQSKEKDIKKRLIVSQQNKEFPIQLFFHHLAGHIIRETHQIKIEELQFGILF